MAKCGGSTNLDPKLKDITTVVLSWHFQFPAFCYEVWNVNFYTSFKYQAYLSVYGNYGLEPVWLPLRSNACSTYLLVLRFKQRRQLPMQVVLLFAAKS